MDERTPIVIPRKSFFAGWLGFFLVASAVFSTFFLLHADLSNKLIGSILLGEAFVFLGSTMISFRLLLLGTIAPWALGPKKAFLHSLQLSKTIVMVLGAGYLLVRAIFYILYSIEWLP